MDGYNTLFYYEMSHFQIGNCQLLHNFKVRGVYWVSNYNPFLIN